MNSTNPLKSLEKVSLLHSPPTRLITKRKLPFVFTPVFLTQSSSERKFFDEGSKAECRHFDGGRGCWAWMAGVAVFGCFCVFVFLGASWWVRHEIFSRVT